MASEQDIQAIIERAFADGYEVGAEPSLGMRGGDYLSEQDTDDFSIMLCGMIREGQETKRLKAVKAYMSRTNEPFLPPRLRSRLYGARDERDGPEQVSSRSDGIGGANPCG